MLRLRTFPTALLIEDVVAPRDSARERAVLGFPVSALLPIWSLRGVGDGGAALLALLELMIVRLRVGVVGVVEELWLALERVRGDTPWPWEAPAAWLLPLSVGETERLTGTGLLWEGVGVLLLETPLPWLAVVVAVAVGVTGNAISGGSSG